MLRSPLSSRPTIYIYEHTPGGVGYSQKLYSIHRDLLMAAKQLIESCLCAAGCPSCVGPVMEVGEHGKSSAIELLKAGI
jgi:DEAD/DEAH box helicase domain-containing protein